jgi:trehalose 6-phosphate phosphatase
VDAVAAAHPDLRKAHGKKLFEIRPALDWDKGRALLWLLDAMKTAMKEDVVPIYLGDDLTDEDAFRAILGHGVGVLVSDEPRATAAEYSLRDPDEVRQLLSWLAGRDDNTENRS